MNRIVAIAAPPLTGKTTCMQKVKTLLEERDGLGTWLYLDNELAFTPELRLAAAELSGLSPDHPQFRHRINRQAQIAYQEMARFFADQGFNVLMPTPFGDLTREFDGRPLFEKLVDDDFYDYRFEIIYLLLWPKDDPQLTSRNIYHSAAMEEVEKEIQRRRHHRQQYSAGQQSLDKDKADSHFYRKRSEQALRTIETYDLELVKYFPGETPDEVAAKIAAIISGPQQ